MPYNLLNEKLNPLLMQHLSFILTNNDFELLININDILINCDIMAHALTNFMQLI